MFCYVLQAGKSGNKGSVKKILANLIDIGTVFHHLSNLISVWNSCAFDGGAKTTPTI